jgi:cytochrome P450
MGSAALDALARLDTDDLIDFGSEQFQTDPWPVYRELRRSDPVHWIAANRMYFVLRYEDVAHALTDDRLATDFPVRASRRIFGSTMLDADGAGHRALRQGFGTLFSAKAVGGYGAQLIAEAVEATLAPLADCTSVDFAQRVAARLPYEVTTRLLGVPPEDGPWLRDHVRAVARGLDFPGGPLAEAQAAESALCDYLQDAARRTSRTAGSAVPSLLDLLAQRAGAPEDPRFGGTAVLFLLAGTETSEAALCTMMLALLSQPGPDEVVDWSDRDAVAAGIREALRWEPPTQSILRYATDDLTIRGVHIPRRSAVLLSLASANRDEEVFEEPDRWWPGRPARRSLTFGAGPHTCLGIHLAYAEFEALAAALGRRFTDIALDGPPPPLRGHGFRRPVRLDLRWRQRRRQGGPRS